MQLIAGNRPFDAHCINSNGDNPRCMVLSLDSTIDAMQLICIRRAERGLLGSPTVQR
jgi:hypothetical protein